MSKFCIMIIIYLLAYSAPVKAKQKEESIKIILKIENIKSDNGDIRIGFYNKEKDAFEPKSAIYGIDVKAKKGFIEREIEIKSGEYAIGIFHDKNSNKMLDINFLGIPKESYGFSGTATTKDFEDALISIDKPQTVVIKLR